MSKVTVAICTYNRAGYLRESIESVLNQTFKDIDIIIYDNASTDDTEEVVRSFTDTRISYHRNQVNIGYNANWNQAISLCKTDYLVVFHDDDIMLPHMIEEELKLMNKYPDVAIVGQMFCHIDIDQNGNVTSQKTTSCDEKYYAKDELITSMLGGLGNFISCPSVMYRARLIKDNKLMFDEQCGAFSDWLLWMQINTILPVAGITRKPIMKYRIHQNNESIICGEAYDSIDSFYYVEKWLGEKGYTLPYEWRLMNITYMVRPYIIKAGYVSPSVVRTIINEFKIRYSWDINIDSLLAEKILAPLVFEIACKRKSVADYYKLKRDIKKAFGISPSCLRSIIWPIKYFFLKRLLIKD